MAVRAKFRVNSVGFVETSVYRDGKYEQALARQVNMTAVGNTGNPEDQEFWTATPNGQCSMTIVNEGAGEMFDPGGEYYVTFEQAKPGHQLILYRDKAKAAGD